MSLGKEVDRGISGWETTLSASLLNLPAGEFGKGKSGHVKGRIVETEAGLKLGIRKAGRTTEVVLCYDHISHHQAQG